MHIATIQRWRNLRILPPSPGLTALQKDVGEVADTLAYATALHDARSAYKRGPAQLTLER